MAYTKLNFTRPALTAITPAPPGKRLYFSDAKERGLLLSVTSAGSKTFQVYIKAKGRPVRVTLGRFGHGLPDSVELPKDCDVATFLANAPELNVRMARALAAQVKMNLRAGESPNVRKHSIRHEITLGELFREYIERYAIPGGKKTVADMQNDFARYLGQLPAQPRKPRGKKREKSKGSVNWENRPLSTISRGDIATMLGKLIRLGNRRAAIGALKLLRTLFTKAIQWGYYGKANPAAGIAAPRYQSRDRFLEGDEMPRFFKAVAEETSKDVRDFVLLSLLTGARKSNVLSIRWADVNLTRSTLRLPDTKNSEPQTIPLIPEALEVLKSRLPSQQTEFVFPGHGASGHLTDPKRGWERLLTRAEIIGLRGALGKDAELPKRGKTMDQDVEGLDQELDRLRTLAKKRRIDSEQFRIRDLRIHDLRRTLGSWQAATGASLVVIGKTLNHKDAASTQIYARLNLDPVRQAMQTATSAMFTAGGLKPMAEIVPIKKPSRQKHMKA